MHLSSVGPVSGGDITLPKMQHFVIPVRLVITHFLFNFASLNM